MTITSINLASLPVTRSTRTILQRFISNSAPWLSTKLIQPPCDDGQPNLTSLEIDQVKTQFNHQPPRPKPQSEVLQFLPPAQFKLRIVSISYNRPTVHGLLNPNFPISRCIRYTDPNRHFTLTAIPPRFANLNHPIPPYLRSLNSCFSKEDQERWRLKRIERRKSSSKPIHEVRLTFSLRIKELHKSSVIRKSIRKRWIAALKLIVQYGAHLSRSTNGIRNSNRSSSPPFEKYSKSNSLEVHLEHDLISLDRNESGFDKWLDKEHYYIIHPSLSLNTVGLVELVDSIRSGLQQIKSSISSPNPRALKRSSKNTPMASRGDKNNQNRKLPTSDPSLYSQPSRLVKLQSVDSLRARSPHDSSRTTIQKFNPSHQRKHTPSLSSSSDQAASRLTNRQDRHDRSSLQPSNAASSCPPRPPKTIPIPIPKH